MQDEKKSLKELLAMKKKKKKPTQKTQSAPKEDEEPNQNAVGDSMGDSQDAQSPDMPKQHASSKPKDDDDESDDETNYTAKTNTKIVEHQADSSKKQDVIEVPDYMMKPEEKPQGADDGKKPVKRKDASNIQFSGRPQFGGFVNRGKARGILGGDDFQTLDQVVEGKQDKTQKNKKSNADGGNDFVSLGSTPVQRKKFEEEKEKEKPKGPPKFFNANKGKNVVNKEAPSTGQNITYDFAVKYKSDIPEGKKFGDNKEEGGQPEVRKDKRRINQDKGRFEDKPSGLDDQDIDDGFEIVRNPNQKRRQQRQFNRAKDLDGGEQRRDDDGGPVRSSQQKSAEQAQGLKRGGAFGNIGGDSD